MATWLIRALEVLAILGRSAAQALHLTNERETANTPRMLKTLATRLRTILARIRKWIGRWTRPLSTPGNTLAAFHAA